MTPCETCAFNKPGSGGAANEVNNRLKGQICAHGGIPFFCHHDRSGQEYNWKTGMLGPLELPPAERRICQGWRGAVAKLNADGQFFRGMENADDRGALLRYQRGLANDATALIDAYLAEREPAAKETLRAKLEDHCRAVFDVPEGSA